MFLCICKLDSVGQDCYWADLFRVCCKARVNDTVVCWEVCAARQLLVGATIINFGEWEKREKKNVKFEFVEEGKGRPVNIFLRRCPVAFALQC